MKALRILSCLPLILFGFAVKAQTETVAPKPKKLQQLYLGFGGGPARTYAPDLKKGGAVFLSHLNLSFSKTTFFRAGYHFALLSDNLKNYPDLTYRGSPTPYHEVKSYYLSVGARRQLGKSFLILATAGISYNQHFLPVNVRHIPKSTLFIFPVGDSFAYETIRKNKPGFIIQTEILWAEQLNYFGISLGTFFQYIPDASHGGLTLALNPGMLSRK